MEVEVSIVAKIRENRRNDKGIQLDKAYLTLKGELKNMSIRNIYPPTKAKEIDILKFQNKLYLKSYYDVNHVFDDLYNLFTNRVVILSAIRKVCRNSGAYTSGIDGFSKKDLLTDKGRLSETKIQVLADKLSDSFQQYSPLPVRRVEIPKPLSQKKRKLGIPTFKDRIAQQTLRTIIEPIYEARFHNLSFGFRPMRNTFHAAYYIRTKIQTGNDWIIEGDICSYFDTINHQRMVNQLKITMEDRDMLNVCWKMLRAGFCDKLGIHKTIMGTPQGGIISPLFANIYLDPADWWFNTIFNKNHEAYWIRYADDFVIVCRGKKTRVRDIKDMVKLRLEEMNLTLSEDKTMISSAKEGFNFLGFHFCMTERLKTAEATKGRNVTYVTPRKEALVKFRKAIWNITMQRDYAKQEALKIMELNRVITGWGNYFRFCQYTPIIGSLDWYVQKKYYHWLWRKHNRIAYKVLRSRFRTSLTGKDRIPRIRWFGEKVTKKKGLVKYGLSSLWETHIATSWQKIPIEIRSPPESPHIPWSKAVRPDGWWEEGLILPYAIKGHPNNWGKLRNKAWKRSRGYCVFCGERAAEGHQRKQFAPNQDWIDYGDGIKYPTQQVKTNDGCKIALMDSMKIKQITVCLPLCARCHYEVHHPRPYTPEEGYLYPNQYRIREIEQWEDL